MGTYTKNIHQLKEALFAKLNNDVTLQGLLGGNGKIFHRDPPKEPVYPLIVYGIINDTDSPYNETQVTGEITRTNIRITIFSDNSKTEISDNIESRIKVLLNGQRTLDSTEIICYSCLRDSLVEPIKDPNLEVWITPIRYRVTWASR
jgi:hypothetical protein